MGVLTTDRDWAAIDNQICRIVRFTPLAEVIGGKVVHSRWSTPYALVALECPRLSSETIGAITDKTDFLHLWIACADSRLTNAEEVNVAWIKSNLKGPAKWFSRAMPGLAVMICNAGTYELINDPNCQPELTGEARAKAEMPILSLVPDVLK